MTIQPKIHTNEAGQHNGMTRFTVVVAVALLSISLLSGCAGTDEQVVEPESRDVDEQQLPIVFNPPFEMTFFSAQQQLRQRGQVLATDINYIGPSNNAHANFFVQDLQDADRVFVDQSGDGDSLSAAAKRTHSGSVKSMGESSSGRRLEFQQYLLDDERACVMVIKYAGDDGAGDTTSSGEPRGSVSIFADFCEAGTEQLTAQRRQQWIDSFQYRTN